MSCKECQSYYDLRIPKKVDDKNYIYGYCFKDNYNMEKGHAIYIPGGSCKEFIACKDSKDYKYEIDPAFKCECCKKELLSKMTKLIG